MRRIKKRGLDPAPQVACAIVAAHRPSTAALLGQKARLAADARRVEGQVATLRAQLEDREARLRAIAGQQVENARLLRQSENAPLVQGLWTELSLALAAAPDAATQALVAWSRRRAGLEELL